MRKTRRFFAAALSFLLTVSLFPASAKADEAAAAPDLSGMTVFTFSGSTVTVAEGADTNYEVVVYNSADEESEPVGTDNDNGTVTYSIPDGTEGELQVSIKKKGGSYVFEGEGTGSIAVKKEATGDSTLYLDGLTLASEITAPITVKKDSTAACTIYAVEDTTNTLTDSEANNDDTNTENAAAESAVIKGKASADITLTGGGILNLNCFSKNAVKVGDNGALRVENLTLNVTSSGHGISSDNALTVDSGTITVVAGSDGIRSDPDVVADDTTTGDGTATGDGCITINGGDITVTAGKDGIQAAQDLTINGGTFDITTAGGYDAVYDKDTDDSAKGLKASGSDDDIEEATNTVTITGGTFRLNTADDAVHSDGYIVITGGNFSIQTGDDGIHADTSLTVGEENGSNDAVEITVANSYEGLEAGNVYLYSGTFSIISSDDGINAAGGTDSSVTSVGGTDSTDGTVTSVGTGSTDCTVTSVGTGSTDCIVTSVGTGSTVSSVGGTGSTDGTVTSVGIGMGGNDHFNAGGGPGSPGNNNGWSVPDGFATGDYSLNVYGGKIFVNAGSDGLDSNGSMTLSGGDLVIWGQASGGDGAPFDCDGSITLNGATVFAAGSKSMSQLPTSTSGQTYLSSTASAAAGKTINVQQNGTTQYNILALKNVDFILYSSPEMTSSSGWSIVINEDALIETEDGDESGDTESGSEDSGTESGSEGSGTEGGSEDSGTESGSEDSGTESGSEDSGTESGSEGNGTDSGSENDITDSKTDDSNGNSDTEKVDEPSGSQEETEKNDTDDGTINSNSDDNSTADSSSNDSTANSSSDDSAANSSSDDDSVQNSSSDDDSAASSIITAPTLKATAKTYKAIRLSWDKVPGASKYRIYRAAGKKNGTYKLIKTVKGSVKSYTDKTVKTGTKYYYKISVESADGSVASSSAVSAKTTLSNAKLKKAVQNEDGAVKLKWKKVKGATGYLIYASGKKNTSYKKIAVVKKASKVSYTLKDSVSSQYRYYKIRAYRTVNGKKVYSAYSNIKKAQ